MTNHLHLVVEILPEKMDGFQNDLISRHTLQCNGCKPPGVPLFDPPDRAFRVNADAYLLQLIRRGVPGLCLTGGQSGGSGDPGEFTVLSRTVLTPAVATSPAKQYRN